MNYYPEQLEQIAKLCRALNSVDDENEGKVSIGNRIPVVDSESDTDILGHLVDEIGGAWSFEPIKDGDR